MGLEDRACSEVRGQSHVGSKVTQEQSGAGLNKVILWAGLPPCSFLLPQVSTPVPQSERHPPTPNSPHPTPPTPHTSTPLWLAWP